MLKGEAVATRVAIDSDETQLNTGSLLVDRNPRVVKIIASV
jgi:hypothetical protein